MAGVYSGVLNIVAEEIPKPRSSMAELGEIAAAISKGDNLPNTKVSLSAGFKHRALLIAVQHEGDRRNAEGKSLRLPASPQDVLRVYSMLLTRGYEPQNIRILVAGVTGDPSSYPTKFNILDSLEWLFHNAKPGDHRYFHFSGHGYAYEVGEGEGKVVRVKLAPLTAIDYPGYSDPAVCGEQPGPSPFNSHVKFYREALLTEWEYPSFHERIERRMEGPVEMDVCNRIDEKEFNSMIAKLPKGCILTMTLDCFHGARMSDINYEPEGPHYRGGADEPTTGLEDEQPINNSPDVYTNTSPRNLFIPPAFHLYSNFSFNPKVTVERIQGPGPLDGVQATVFVWSVFITSHARAGDFTSAFTSVAQELQGNISHREVLQEISRRIGDGTGENDGSLVQLLTSLDGGHQETEDSLNEVFVI